MLRIAGDMPGHEGVRRFESATEQWAMNSTYICTAPPPVSLTIQGSDRRFPVHRVYCIGRNYEAHAKEMQATVNLEAPVFFSKPADALVQGGDVPYPSATSDLHHEVELVAALGCGGRDLSAEQGLAAVIAYGVGLDLTRRDLQAQAKAKGTPWDTAKGFDHSAPISLLSLVADIGHPSSGTLQLHVNGSLRQQVDIADMVLKVGEIIAALSRFYELRAGDLVFTGTPAGVAALRRGDQFRASFPAIADLTGSIV
jgi:fumarylpyruvate hydrolase